MNKEQSDKLDEILNLLTRYEGLISRHSSYVDLSLRRMEQSIHYIKKEFTALADDYQTYKLTTQESVFYCAKKIDTLVTDYINLKRKIDWLLMDHVKEEK